MFFSEAFGYASLVCISTYNSLAIGLKLSSILQKIHITAKLTPPKISPQNRKFVFPMFPLKVCDRKGKIQIWFHYTFFSLPAKVSPLQLFIRVRPKFCKNSTQNSFSPLARGTMKLVDVNNSLHWNFSLRSPLIFLRHHAAISSVCIFCVYIFGSPWPLEGISVPQMTLVTFFFLLAALDYKLDGLPGLELGANLLDLWWPSWKIGQFAIPVNKAPSLSSEFGAMLFAATSCFDPIPVKWWRIWS